MSLVKQIIKEFWIPSVLATTWTAYSIYTSADAWTITKIINIFGPSFFLVSWATGQFFRVRKQAKVESNLSTIEERVEHLVSSLEKHTKDFFGYTTGGDSIAQFMPMFTSQDILELGLHNSSEYPVFDIHSELIDLDEKIDPEKGVFWTRHRFSLESLYPQKMRMGVYRFDLRGKDSLRINVFIHTRSSSATQQIRIARVDGQLLIAIETTSGNETIEQRIPNNFPGYDENEPKNVFK